MMKLKVPGSHWAWGQIFHSCTPNTKITFILSLSWYFRCLKQNSPLSHANWVSSLLVFALLLWAELVGFSLGQSRQNSTAKTSWFLRKRSCILTRLPRKIRIDIIIIDTFSSLQHQECMHPIPAIYLEEQEDCEQILWLHPLSHQDFICSFYH